MTLQELQQLFTEAVKITRKERSMRSYVFRDKPTELAAKLADIDRLEYILTTFKDALKATATPSDTPEQQPLLDVPKKQDYP